MFKNGTGRHQNNIELGKFGRSRSNVWQYAGVNSFRKDRLADLTVHPTVKPVALVADAMRDCSRRGDIVLDPFMGSGTTILAAEKVGRRAYGIEIDPLVRRRGDPPLAGIHQARRGSRGHRPDLRRGGRRALCLRCPQTREDLTMASIPKIQRVFRKRVRLEPRDEDVGYGKPPKAHRFKPGQSGNPKGRKNGAKNEATILQELLQHKVTLTERGKPRKITLREAIYRRIAEDSLKGNIKSATFLFNRDQMISMGSDAIREGLGDDDKAVLEAYLKELQPKSSEDVS